MHKTTCLLTAFLALSLPGRTAEIPSSGAVAEAEAEYADVADSYGILSTIDSGMFATYQGKDRAAWERIYGEKRKELTEKLGKISASSLSPLDARALDVMNRHLQEDFPEQFRDENAPPEHCQDAQRQDLSMKSLEGALHSCFTEVGNNLEFEGTHGRRPATVRPRSTRAHGYLHLLPVISTSETYQGRVEICSIRSKLSLRASSPVGSLLPCLRNLWHALRSDQEELMPYRISGIDMHKKEASQSTPPLLNRGLTKPTRTLLHGDQHPR